MTFFWRIVNSIFFGLLLIAVGQFLNVAGDDAWCRYSGASAGTEGVCSDGTLVPDWLSMLAAGLLLLGLGVVLGFVFRVHSAKVAGSFEASGGRQDDARRADARKTPSSQGSPRPRPLSMRRSDLQEPLFNSFHPHSPLREDSEDIASSSRRAKSSSLSHDSTASISGSSESYSSSSSDSGSSCSSSCD